jgi:hypothetical protein
MMSFYLYNDKEAGIISYVYVDNNFFFDVFLFVQRQGSWHYFLCVRR